MCHLFSSLARFRSAVKNELVGARIESVPVAVVAVVVQVVVGRVVVGRLGVVVEAAGRLVDETRLAPRDFLRLRLDFVDEVEDIFFLFRLRRLLVLLVNLHVVIGFFRCLRNVLVQFGQECLKRQRYQ